MKRQFESPLIFQDSLVPAGTKLVGWAALVQELGLEAPVRKPCCVSESYIRGSYRTEKGWKIFDKRYDPGPRFQDHLSFSLRHEPIDLLILKRTFEIIPMKDMEEFVKTTPTGALARRAWFFFEELTGKRLDIEDAPIVAAVEALNSKAYFTAMATLSKRHRVKNNLLGSGDYCPIIRRTEKLEKLLEAGLAQKAAKTVGQTGSHVVARAASFLLLADSRASFEIEGERPPRNRLERWGRAVLEAGKNNLTLGELNRLHGVLIEDMRFIQSGLRTDGVFLGARDHYDDPLPEFIGARPDDLHSLMTGLLNANDNMRASGLDPVLQAAATAFGFVYVHPYQDGNGRVHRCLIHHVLADRGFTPPGILFPVSSVMQKRIEEYRLTLKNHSGPLMDFIKWRPTPERNVEVLNDTADLYRYFDCTEAAEFLYTCVERTIEHDLPNEIAYLRRHDEAQRRIMEMVEMPDRLAQNLIMFMRQNAGTIPRRRREKEFAALTEDEVQKIEEIYQDIFGEDEKR